MVNAWKQALVQGIGWNLMLLVAHLTGRTPRGGSVRRGAACPEGGGRRGARYAWGLGAATPAARIGALVALAGMLAAVIGYLRAPRPGVRASEGRACPRFPRRGRGRKWALSQGC